VTHPELWGGVECTLNRVGDRWFDQLERSGHADRAADLERIASLGIRALRYPVLWERTAPRGIETADWRWADERLGLLRAAGLRPIVGLLHHGSGPAGTSLVDPEFPARLAAYAGAVAARYPWVEDWTPVNEPLTTARFSGLYGHWFPHGRDDRSFVRALVGQCLGTALAMRAIRRVTPGARLIVTEDFGRTWAATPALEAQAAYENLRRFLGLDLLCGRMDRHHPLRRYLLDHGAREEELDLFTGERPPAVVGINYYITSDRYLDDRLEHYPAWSHGGNGHLAYADVEAARARPQGILGHDAALRTVWERYHLPVALTEVHLGAGREDQLAWLVEAWDAARAVRRGGVDMRAMTVWSLLGAYDWDRLVTEDRGFYEPGAFDVRGGVPRPTALARVVRALAAGEIDDHPGNIDEGWWRRPERLTFGPDRVVPAEPGLGSGRDARAPRAVRRRPPVLIVGRGTLGSAFARLCTARSLRHEWVGRQELDIADRASIDRALEELSPWAVINAAGYVRVDDAEREPERCFRENTQGPGLLAAACAERGLALCAFSSDLVFDGVVERPYLEADRPAPLGVYGQSKALGEQAVLEALPGALVVRTSSFFGPWDSANFLSHALARLEQGLPFEAAGDVTVSPTYVPDLVHTCLDLLIDGEGGLWHVANRGALTWAELAQLVARHAGLDPGLVQARPLAALRLPAPRPRFSALASARGHLLPAVDDGVARFLREREPTPAPKGKS
jgi:dTDP-4-dehydrorhamnose reductase